MALETRKDKMDHMFALMEESRVLVGRLGEHEDIEATIRQLNYRVEELKKELYEELRVLRRNFTRSFIRSLIRSCYHGLNKELDELAS